MKYKKIDELKGYRFGEDGSVWSCKIQGGHGRLGRTWKKLSQSIVQKYLVVAICNNGIEKTMRVHRLILTAFIGMCPEGMIGCHNDGNRLNNKISNLRWDTQKNNHADKHKHGTAMIGEKNGSSKLKKQQILKIRKLYSDGLSQREIAAIYKIAQTQVSNIVTMKSWTHIDV